MTEQPEPIPPNYSEAFDRAVRRYSDWSRDSPELGVTIDGKKFSMSTVCDFVSKYDDPLPDDIFRCLHSYMSAEHRDLKERLGRTPTYSTAAYCLRKLIEDRKAGYERLQQVRRDKGLND
jgi:hypothetical protein